MPLLPTIFARKAFVSSPEKVFRDQHGDHGGDCGGGGIDKLSSSVRTERTDDLSLSYRTDDLSLSVRTDGDLLSDSYRVDFHHDDQNNYSQQQDVIKEEVVSLRARKQRIRNELSPEVRRKQELMLDNLDSIYQEYEAYRNGERNYNDDDDDEDEEDDDDDYETDEEEEY